MSEPAAKSAAVDDERTPQEIKQDKELADRLSALIEDANERVIPLCKQIRKHIENMKARPDEDKNEDELIKAVRPLIEEVEKLLFIAIAMGISASSVTSLQAKQGLPIVNQVSGWAVLVLASLFPFTKAAKHNSPSSRIVSLFLGFGVCFVILSISVEGHFYASLTATLALWVEVEAMVRPSSEGQSKEPTAYTFQVDDLRIAMFFLFFVQIAFFGTGNVASISSFYLEPVYRLVPIFDPFLMGSLLIFKIIAPYVILSVFFSALNSRLRLPPFSLFLVALTLTDVMTITFFLNVTDTGSWLEIGQSITFFCIASLLLVWSAGICVIGEYLMADTFAAPKAKVN
ncbi:PigN-domain-containing protein [Athelia psychrophila]|uniref:GPI ethanolamine phosphate transferase 1 n=1 Tax=Athelia psychrophila TaxID=1759441 RepID=A0A166R4Y8_9AGAM|nr:PigN-domain-containing protein [Fibularhizoctonia sp. CBS 109695]